MRPPTRTHPPEIRLKMAITHAHRCAREAGRAVLIINLSQDEWRAVRWAMRASLDGGETPPSREQFDTFGRRAVAGAVGNVAAVAIRRGEEVPVEVADCLGEIREPKAASSWRVTP